MDRKGLFYDITNNDHNFFIFFVILLHLQFIYLILMDFVVVKDI